MAIKIEMGRAGTISLEDGRKVSEPGAFPRFNIGYVNYVEASGDHLRQIIQDFTPVAYIASAYCCVTIPISGLKSQRWYGDTAKTIIYALLQ